MSERREPTRIPMGGVDKCLLCGWQGQPDEPHGCPRYTDSAAQGLLAASISSTVQAGRREEVRLMDVRESVRRYDELVREIGTHLEGPVEPESDDDVKSLVCGCVLSSYPEVEERCDAFYALTKERGEMLDRILTWARSA